MDFFFNNNVSFNKKNYYKFQLMGFDSHKCFAISNTETLVTIRFLIKIIIIIINYKFSFLSGLFIENIYTFKTSSNFTYYK